MTRGIGRAKTYLEGALDIGMQGTSQRTAVYGLGQLHHGRWNAFQAYIETMRQISAADVQRVAQTYLNPIQSVRVILRAALVGEGANDVSRQTGGSKYPYAIDVRST